MVALDQHQDLQTRAKFGNCVFWLSPGLLKDQIFGGCGRERTSSKYYFIDILCYCCLLSLTHKKIVIQVIESYHGTMSVNSHMTTPCLLACFSLPSAVMCVLSGCHKHL